MDMTRGPKAAVAGGPVTCWPQLVQEIVSGCRPQLRQALGMRTPSGRGDPDVTPPGANLDTTPTLSDTPQCPHRIG